MIKVMLGGTIVPNAPPATTVPIARFCYSLTPATSVAMPTFQQDRFAADNAGHCC